MLKMKKAHKYILLDLLVCSIADNFYELCRILTSPTVEEVKIQHKSKNTM